MRTTKNHAGREISLNPGTYNYSGFGMGTLIVSEDKEEDIWCTAKEACAKCAELGLEYRFVDPLEGYSGTYLGD